MPATKVKMRVREEAALPTDLYELDFNAWTIEQAAALRDGRTSDLDFVNLAEEVEDLGGAVFKELRSSFRIILVHMLKWDHQPERRSRSWAGSIKTHRLEISFTLKRNPSLRRRQVEAIAIAYSLAKIRASVEMKRPERELPPDCPYDLDEILHRSFEWPEA